MSQAPPPSTVTVVLVNWNSGDLLGECLTSLRGQLPGDRMKVVIVDNDSADDSAARAEDALPEARLFRNTENVGFARAVNQALTDLDSDYALLLNPDSQVPPGALAALLEFADQHPDVGALGPRLVDPGGRFRVRNGGEQPTMRTVANHFLFLSTLFAGRRWADGYQRVNDPSGPHDQGWLCGACLLLRREALQQIGLLDERWFLNVEDVEIGNRMAAAGWRVVYLPSVEVIHLVGGGRRGDRSRITERDRPGCWISTLRSYFVWRNNPSGLGLAAFDLTVLIGLLARSAYYFVRSLAGNNATAWRAESAEFRDHAGDLLRLSRLGRPDARLLQPRVPRFRGERPVDPSAGAAPDLSADGRSCREPVV